MYKIKLRKGDKVIVRSGKYKGKTGTILSVQGQENKVTVEGINIVKRHTKPNRQYPQGGIIEITKPIWTSKVGFYDQTSKKASRIGIKVDNDGNRNRVLKTTGKEIK
jgi:large subunit ribosomal protein L24